MTRRAEIAMAEPKLLTRQDAAARCSLSISGFASWVKQGKLPGAIPGTHRWHVEALDAALDRLAGVARTMEPKNPLDEWLESHGRH